MIPVMLCNMVLVKLFVIYYFDALNENVDANFFISSVLMWPVGVVVKDNAIGAGGCGFDSWAG